MEIKRCKRATISAPTQVSKPEHPLLARTQPNPIAPNRQSAIRNRPSAKKWLCTFLVLLAMLRQNRLLANPAGMTLVSGAATAQQLGSQLNVTVSQTAVLNWQSFNIAAGETTSFLQPSANSIVLNVIGGANPSRIFGGLKANGTVILENANGFYFGDGSMIKVGGSLITTTAATPPDLGSGAAWQFRGMPPAASIINYGTLEVGAGKSLFLIAENIENHGQLNAPGGSVDLAAGQTVLVSDRPDGRSLSAAVTLPQGSVGNFGSITADAGSIMMQAKVVNQNGILQADSVQNLNGTIELVASDQLNLGANSQILARGDSSAAGSAAGSVTLKSDNVFSDTSGSEIITTGGANGGNGGNIEVSAPDLQSFDSAMDAHAQSGSTGGNLLLDPINIVLNSSGSTTTAPDPTGAINGSGATSSTWNVNVNTAFANKSFSQILLAASGNISLSSGLNWNLSSSTAESSGQLVLEAGGNITFANNSKITDANDWGVSLYAGYNFNLGTISSGAGNIYLNGGSGKSLNGSIHLNAGSIAMFAGQSILLGSGSVNTLGGGSIFACALAGDIDAGTANGGYIYYASGTQVQNPGGIATAAGGDVTLLAGNNITSVPNTTLSANQSAGGSGTYGDGNVTVVAGDQITGNFTLANGTGTMLAGQAATAAQATALADRTGNPAAYAAALQNLQSAVTSGQNQAANIGTQASPVTLDLIAGSWNVWAANSIYLEEVRNPNATFNTDLQFNYAADAAVHLWAGNHLTLDGGSLQRIAGYDGDMPPIYAPILSLSAGAGGITVDNTLYLYPSSQGALAITTRNGGNLTGALQTDSSLVGIIMSDAGAPTDAEVFEYKAIKGNDQSAVPLHLNDDQPVTVDVSGSIGNFQLTVPTFAEITVDGLQPYTVGGTQYYGTYNFGFSGRNLSPAQTSFLHVTGDISYRGDLTIESLADPLPAALFSASTDPNVTSRLQYNAATGSLIFIGVMSGADLAFLLNPTIYVTDQFGNPQTVALNLTATQQAVLNQLYTDSQSASISKESLALTGPGVFDLTARNIDLGISGGILADPLDSQSFAISHQGTTLNVTTTGDVNMTASEIANESLGGGINLTVGGTLNVGGEYTAFDDPNAARGIFTMSGGSLLVSALTGDVNVNGSRIAAYNGGNITVLSQNGNVNAGTGGAGFVSVHAQEIDPVTGDLTSLDQSIPGSGILATTLPGSNAKLGNILVQTANGNITASQGGVIQISFNDTDSSQATTELLAGYALRDAGGSQVSAANLADGTAVRVSEKCDVDAGGSGVIAQNIIAQATGEAKGLFIGQGSVNIAATSIGQTLIVTPGKVDVTGDQTGPTVQIISEQSHTDNGITATTDAPASNVAKTEAPTADTAATAANKVSGSDEDDLTGDSKSKGKGNRISLAQKVSRVTVLLPAKN